MRRQLIVVGYLVIEHVEHCIYQGDSYCRSASIRNCISKPFQEYITLSILKLLKRAGKPASMVGLLFRGGVQ